MRNLFLTAVTASIFLFFAGCNNDKASVTQTTQKSSTQSAKCGDAKKATGKAQCGAGKCGEGK